MQLSCQAVAEDQAEHAVHVFDAPCCLGTIWLARRKKSNKQVQSPIASRRSKDIMQEKLSWISSVGPFAQQTRHHGVAISLTLLSALRPYILLCGCSAL